MMFRKTLIAAALTALAVPAFPAAAQEAEDFTARLNRLPGQAALAPPEPDPEPTIARQVEPAPAAAPPVEDFTARLNRAPGGATPPPLPEPDPETETSSEPPVLEGLSGRLEQMRREPVAPEPEPAPPEPEPIVEAETEAAPEPVLEPAPPPALEILDSQAGLAFRVDLPEAFDLVARPSGPDFDVYQVSRGETPFVSIYVGCCSLFPIYSGRQTEAGGRLSILINEGGANRAVEHLFVRESDGRQIHVWLHSVTGEDRALAERIAQTVDPR